ncbi:hypothetical protein HanXRQr2_Chr10g0424931 [Helianthus annuus]|uniref:Uncharacterized protein n=1 Tax=Helianthus annuus TaxID=4232 RepID=A0A9K3HVB8_HELAN|nr:hypothetical protein HanXRQr2_Chr10g0424931 [Helianthus annuus]KAJ0512722.1 hypothetical protein HanHA300_Chr10g0349351 [Helianthus annuus]KAJ0528844.1 hypothetical protein HanHA89_Chr10g0370951 [Helianthus annuus]KAJ0695759.1 hypothetical protein HanLR1_Chr10g0349171 [Helianthus annuus]
MMYMAKKRRDGLQGYNGVRTKNDGAHDALYRSENPDKQETTPPDNVLEDDMLALLLKQSSGFKDVRMIHAKLGITFVEFDEKKITFEFDEKKITFYCNAIPARLKITPQKCYLQKN